MTGLEKIKPAKRFKGEGIEELLDQESSSSALKCAYEGCKKEFSSIRHLKAHLAYHQLRADFVCPVATCKKSFNYRHNLLMHLRVHNDVRPFACPQKCGKSFRTKGNMMDHLRRHYAIK